MKNTTSIIIKCIAIITAILAIVAIVYLFRNEIICFIDKVDQKLRLKRKSKFSEYFDFEDLDSI